MTEEKPNELWNELENLINKYKEHLSPCEVMFSLVEMAGDIGFSCIKNEKIIEEIISDAMNNASKDWHAFLKHQEGKNG